MYRIAWFSSKKENSTAEIFSRDIVPRLGRLVDLTIFGDSSDHEFLSAYRQDFDLHIYNFEDSRDAYFVRSHLGLIPGLTIFHDFFLTSDGPEPILNSPWEETVKKFHDPKRSWADRSREYKRERPQAFREAGLSLISVFTDERSCAECSRVTGLSVAGENAHAYYLPFPAVTSTTWHFDPTRRVVGFHGTPRIEHRAHKLLSAIPNDAKLLWMIDEQEKSEAVRLLEEFGVSNFELRVKRSPEVWESILREASCVCLPLFSVYGHLHPYLEMSLLSGAPVIVTKFGSTEYLSEKLVFHISPGDHETAEFREVITTLLSGNFSQSLANNVRTFAAELYSPDVIASELYSIIEREKEFIADKRAAWRKLEIAARKEVLNDVAKGIDQRWSLESAFHELGWNK